MSLRRVVPCLHIRRRERFLKTSWSPADPNEFCHFHAGDAAFSSGAGEAAFGSGADIDEFEQIRADKQQASGFAKHGHRAMHAVRDCPIPT